MVSISNQPNITNSQQVNNAPIEQKQQVSLAQAPDTFESSQNKAKEKKSFLPFAIIGAAALAIGVFLTKGHLWGKVTEKPKPPEKIANPDKENLEQELEDFLCDKVPEKAKKLIKKLHERAEKSFEQQEYSKAIRDYTRAIKIYPKNHIAYAQRGLVHEYANMPQKAFHDYSKSIKIEPRNPMACACRANLTKDKDAKKALYDLAEAIQVYPEDARLNELQDYLLEKLNIDKLVLGDRNPIEYVQAQDKLELLNTKIASGQRDYETYMSRGYIHGYLGDKKQALKDYNRAIKLEPKDPESYIARAILLRAKSPEKALNDFNTAIKLDPQNPIYYNRRGNLLANLEKLPEALQDANKAIELAPENPHLYSLRIAINNMLGNKDAIEEDKKTVSDIYTKLQEPQS